MSQTYDHPRLNLLDLETKVPFTCERCGAEGMGNRTQRFCGDRFTPGTCAYLNRTAKVRKSNRTRRSKRREITHAQVDLDMRAV